MWLLTLLLWYRSSLLCCRFIQFLSYVLNNASNKNITKNDFFWWAHILYFVIFEMDVFDDTWMSETLEADASSVATMSGSRMPQCFSCSSKTPSNNIVLCAGKWNMTKEFSRILVCIWGHSKQVIISFFLHPVDFNKYELYLTSFCTINTGGVLKKKINVCDCTQHCSDRWWPLQPPIANEK